ncbi:unnamed protein product [Ilex paraguariensis]|uniref:Uncharacterized protein n=1 Tax=Ilex paraguariensis TaxID=185542 RepID=A0ABC8TXM1_9AQUA
MPLYDVRSLFYVIEDMNQILRISRRHTIDPIPTKFCVRDTNRQEEEAYVQNSTDTTISTFGGSFPMPIVSVNVEAEKVEVILVTQLTDGSRFETGWLVLI